MKFSYGNIIISFVPPVFLLYNVRSTNGRLSWLRRTGLGSHSSCAVEIEGRIQDSGKGGGSV